MCDYSLHSIQNRLAVDGEQLVLHRFSTGTVGLTNPAAPGQALPAAPVAVCIPPGAELMLNDIPEDLQTLYAVGPRAKVTFTQLTADAHCHRDAIRFENGREVLLQRLKEGQRVVVLSLGSGSSPSVGQEEFARVFV